MIGLRSNLFALASVLMGQSIPPPVSLPIGRSWLVNPAAQSVSSPALRAILPNVQNVRIDGDSVLVESAGLALQSLSPLDTTDRETSKGPRKFVFRFPLQPKPAYDSPAKTPPGVVAVFLNGVPYYTPVSAVSFRDQNLWHVDAIAAAGRPSPGHAAGSSPLLAALLQANGRHSPLIGFALDGFPIYGPYGWGQDGSVRRFQSSYRLRAISRRAILPDGTELTPSQEGPPVNAAYPLGSFVEDYVYAADSGDLDEHNGRFARTPEYPDGTYAYFLSTDALSRLTYPYLVGASYYGRVSAPAPPADAGKHPPLDSRDKGRIDLTTPGEAQAGRPVALSFAIRDAKGWNIRFLEKVHTQPIHLLIVSSDLAEFAHIHPELQPGDTYAVTHAFPHGGTYWLFADYTPPGEARTVSRFRIEVKGAPRTAEPPHAENVPDFTKTKEGLRVTMTPPPESLAGEDLNFRFDAVDAATGLPVNDLEPYLGAWAHVMIVSEDRRQFIHAHPLGERVSEVDTDPWRHTDAVPGPSPSSVRIIAGFRQPGVYRLWVQFQRQGNVVAIPYTFKVEAAQTRPRLATSIPADAIRVRVGNAGFEPARITATAGKPIRLAFERLDAANCARSVVFPELDIRTDLPPGGTTVPEIPSTGPRELYFTCGMKMYRGSLVIR